MRSHDALLAELRALIAPTFVEVVERRRARFEQRGRAPLERPVELLAIALRLYRWRLRRQQPDSIPSAITGE